MVCCGMLVNLMVQGIEAGHLDGVETCKMFSRFSNTGV